MTSARLLGRPLIFGEVLFDCFPDGTQVLGGAPFNVAWHLQALDLAPHLVSRVGADPTGDEVLAAMGAWQMDRSGVQRDPDHPTGRVAVHLTGGQPSYAILPNQAYDHIAPPDEPEGMALLYHGSLALRQPASRAALAAIRARCAAPVFLDVNLRSPWWDASRVSGLLDGARWCKLNHQELQVLAGPDDPLAAARRLIERHPIERLFVTLGDAGALSLGRAGDCQHISPAGGVAVVDTVGAGDAFAAVLIAGLLRGWPLASTLERAQALASAVCGLRGALPREPRFYPQWDLG